MGQLPTYRNFNEKSEKFSPNQNFFRIDTVDQFDQWYSTVLKKAQNKSIESKIDSINRRKIY